MAVSTVNPPPVDGRMAGGSGGIETTLIGMVKGGKSEKAKGGIHCAKGVCREAQRTRVAHAKRVVVFASVRVGMWRFIARYQFSARPLHCPP